MDESGENGVSEQVYCKHTHVLRKQETKKKDIPQKLGTHSLLWKFSVSISPTILPIEDHTLLILLNFVSLAYTQKSGITHKLRGYGKH